MKTKLKMRPEPKFKEGNAITLHYDEPSAIGYNGMWCIVRNVLWDERVNDWRYYCVSINGTARVLASDKNMKLCMDRYEEPYFGPYIVKVGD